MDNLITVRNATFFHLGQSRMKRIAVCSLGVAAVWCFADMLSGNLAVNLWHDVLCLAFGIVLERIIPWGKPNKATSQYSHKKER